jgi:ATP-dependent DNA helicase RecG
MALPINISELLNGTTVESERIDFKEGWNPVPILRTMCAFANDFNNWGGGYIIIGVREVDGVPEFPPMGLTSSEINTINNELQNISRKIQPNYFPVVEPVDFQDKKILILWCPGGSNRPYNAPEGLEQDSRRFYYIRKFSSTVHPSVEEQHELLSMASKIPFDDRVNHAAAVSAFDLTTIKSFLNEIHSDLEQEIPELSIGDIARKMNIAEGSDEQLLPKNAGLLFFAKYAQEFFPYAKIEIVSFEDEAGTAFTEKIFTGTIQRQLRNSLEYLKDNLVKEKTIKVSSVAESRRFYNYPYVALEEALCNAVFHRGYDNDTTIEVRIFSSRIDIISFPGPLPPLNKEKLRNNQFDVRKYRNRRIGEFLKELHLTEGRATGIPTILKALADNGSPAPMFETDDERTYFKTSFFIHLDFASTPALPEEVSETEQVSVQVREHVNLFIINNLEGVLAACDRGGEQVKEQVRAYVGGNVAEAKVHNLRAVLLLCRAPQKRQIILKKLGLTNIYKNYQSHIVVLIESGLLERTDSNPKNPFQKYRTTSKGEKLLEILK